MTTPRPLLPVLLAAVLAGALLAASQATPAPAAASAAAAGAPLFRFAGKPFVHRWSKGGQHEFTPPAQPDLSAWQDMVTLQVYDKVTNPDELALVTDGVLVAYQKAGLVLRSSAFQATPGLPAEHVVVALLQDKGVREMVFARFRLALDGGGEAIVYSHRVYGTQPDEAADAWFRANGAATEQAMRAWTDIPSVAALRALPQSPP
jgi:hypothetical protein